jgi:type IV secretory pathway protease TraF
MRRITAFSAAAIIAASNLVIAGAAIARPMPQQSGYYVIRWDNTGVCQIWNTELKEQPVRFMSDYKVVSKPVPTFAAAVDAQEKLRFAHRCTL